MLSWYTKIKRETMKAFIANIQTAIIGTLDSNNHPFSSYAPYIYDSNRFYVYISDIATHAKNLQKNPSNLQSSSNLQNTSYLADS